MTEKEEGLKTTHLAIIAVVAILIIAAAVLISFGKNGGTGPVPSAVTTTKPMTTTSAQVQQTLDPASIVVPTTVAISNEGIFIRVQYLGSYTGSYHADGEDHKIWNSGDRLYPIENANQTLSIFVQKTDRSARQPLTVEVWKNGALIKTGSTSDLFGQVNITAAV
jgi:hypothetical protein